MGKEKVKIPLTKFEACEDDSFSVFAPPRWTHFPRSEPIEWWKFLPLKWPVVTQEFGSKLRGMVNRVSKETWIGAHDRCRAWELMVSLRFSFCQTSYI